MNRSGQAVSSLAKYYKIPLEQILVAHDELDLVAGVTRLKLGGGHAGHNGLRDIMSAMAGREFWRLRIGIDHPGSAKDVVDYVLSRPSRDDFGKIEDSLDQVVDLLPRILSGEVQLVMNQLHSTR
jgi:PTH1 family peptidyl-tRNA hydrolase